MDRRDLSESFFHQRPRPFKLSARFCPKSIGFVGGIGSSKISDGRLLIGFVPNFGEVTRFARLVVVPLFRFGAYSHQGSPRSLRKNSAHSMSEPPPRLFSVKRGRSSPPPPGPSTHAAGKPATPVAMPSRSSPLAAPRAQEVSQSTMMMTVSPRELALMAPWGALVFLLCRCVNVLFYVFLCGLFNLFNCRWADVCGCGYFLFLKWVGDVGAGAHSWQEICVVAHGGSGTPKIPS